MIRSLPAALVLIACVAAGARAQQEPRTPAPADAPKIQAPDNPARRLLAGLALGPGLDVVVPTNGRASVAAVPRLSIRFASREGWAPTIGFGWFDTGIDGDQFGGSRRIGELQIRPIMLGARYTWVREAISYDVSGTAGWSFSDFDLDGDVAETLRGQEPIRAEANTSVAWKIQGGVWYDYTDRVAFRGTIAYFRCTPEVTLTYGGQSRRFSQSANAIQLGASVVYRIF
jgi:hypothetical protein